MRKIPKITSIIKGAMTRSGLNAKELAQESGIPYATLMQQRFPYPGSWRFYEFGAIKRIINFTPEEINEINQEMGER